MKRIFKVNMLFLVLLLIMSFLMPIFISIAYSSLKLDFMSLQVFGTLLFIYLPVVIYVLFNRKSFNCSIKEVLSFKPLKGKNIGYCFLIYLLLLPITAFCNLLTSLVAQNNIPDFMGRISSSSSDILLFFTIAIMPAIGEELIMRGVILDGYKKASIHVAAFMNGFLFAIFHMNPSQFLYAFVLGIVFTYLVVYTGSIFSSMLIHFLFNGLSTLAFIVMSNPEKYLPKILVEQMAKQLAAESTNLPVNPALPQLIFSGIIALLAAFLIYLILKKLRKINNFDEKLNFTSHTIDLEDDSSIDDFHAMKPKKTFIVAYSPIIASTLLFILAMIGYFSRS